MVEDTVLRGVIGFFGKLGIYDVVLPFLLIFTIVFSILEKTKVLGTDEIEGKRYSKRNLNAIASFVMALLVVASTRLVALINEAMANVVVLLLLSVSFLLLIGSFFSEKEDVFLEKGPWRTFFMIFMFIGIVLIFMRAVPTKEGDTWLDLFWDYVSSHWSGNVVGSIALMLFIILFIWFVTKPTEPVPKKESK